MQDSQTGVVKRSETTNVHVKTTLAPQYLQKEVSLDSLADRNKVCGQ